MVVRCVPKFREFLRLAVIAGAAVLGACADGGTSTLRPGAATQSNLTGQTLERTFRLGTGDKIKLVVFGEPEMSGTFEIDAAGQIPLPLAGQVSAKGLGIPALRDAIVRRLSDGYLKNPKVSVEVLSYRPIFVHGEVKIGGEFPFKNGLKLRDAIAVAGGYTYRANQGYVLITREDMPREERVDLPSSLLVMPGDNIRIPERFF